MKVKLPPACAWNVLRVNLRQARHGHLPLAAVESDVDRVDALEFPGERGEEVGGQHAVDQAVVVAQ